MECPQILTSNSWIFSSFNLNPYQDLEIRVSAIAKKKFQAGLTEREVADLQKSFQLAHSYSFFAGRMKTILSTIPKETIRLFLFEVMSAKSQREIENAFESTFNVLKEEDFLELSEFMTSDMANLAFEIHGITKIAALKNSFEREKTAILKEFVIEAHYFFHQVLNLLISLSGINELTRHRTNASREDFEMNDFTAHFKLERYWKLLALPVTLFGLIYSTLEFKAAALGLTALTIVASLTTLVAYKRYWKPVPSNCPELKNLSIDLLQKKDSPYPRRPILCRIESAFQAKKGVILVGKPGIGKTQIAYSLVSQTANGKICPFLKDAQFFEGNTANLSSYSLTSIEEHFKHHEDQAVFFFDEFHTLFEKTMSSNNKVTGIKKFCDNFSYVIGATTTAEYEQYIKDQSAIADRRFEIIHLDQMDEEHMEIILSGRLESSFSKIAFDPDVFKYIINKAKEFNPNTSPIDAATTLLTQAIQRMSFISHKDLEDKIAGLEDKLDRLMQKLMYNKLDKQGKEKLLQDYKSKKAELQEEKSVLEKRCLRTKKMQSMEDHLFQLKKQSYLMADEHINLKDHPSLICDWNKLNARIKIVEAFIAKEKEELKLPKALDQNLIDSILAEREKSRQLA